MKKIIFFLLISHFAYSQDITICDDDNSHVYTIGDCDKFFSFPFYLISLQASNFRVANYDATNSIYIDSADIKITAIGKVLIDDDGTFKENNAILLSKTLDPSGKPDGYVYFNTTLHKIRVKISGIWYSLALE